MDKVPFRDRDGQRMTTGALVIYDLPLSHSRFVGRLRARRGIGSPARLECLIDFGGWDEWVETQYLTIARQHE